MQIQPLAVFHAGLVGGDAVIAAFCQGNWSGVGDAVRGILTGTGIVQRVVDHRALCLAGQGQHRAGVNRQIVVLRRARADLRLADSRGGSGDLIGRDLDPERQRFRKGSALHREAQLCHAGQQRLNLKDRHAVFVRHGADRHDLRKQLAIAVGAHGQALQGLAVSVQNLCGHSGRRLFVEEEGDLLFVVQNHRGGSCLDRQRTRIGA